MSNLGTPAFLVDVGGALVFFNDPAGKLLGLRYEEAGPMSPREWGTLFAPIGDDGRPVTIGRLPLTVALNEERPAHARLRIRSVDGCTRDIEVSALPIVGHGGVCGALAIFWEVSDPG
ncbi:MAG: PAS domain-containing protein [Solirubrobacteraceae bacterium]